MNRINDNKKKILLHLFLFITGIFLAFAMTMVFIFWDTEELTRYSQYFLLVATCFYGTATILIVLTSRKIAKIKMILKSRKFRFAMTSIMTIAGFIIGGSSVLIMNWFVPRTFQLYPREFPIEIEQSYKFETVHGNLNETIDYITKLVFNNSNYLNPDNYAWGESYYERGIIHLYNITKNITLLDHALQRMDVVLNNSDRNHDSIPGFGTDKYEDHYVEYIVWDGMILLPLAEAATIIKNTPYLWNNTTYSSRASNYINTCEKVIKKWNDTNWIESQNQGYYLSPPENKTAIFNRINALGRLILQVYKFTNNKTYLKMTEKIANFFLNHLNEYTYEFFGNQKTMYSWGYDWKGKNSDTSHASIDVDFVVSCHENNITFSSIHMRKFANTFIDFVYRGRLYQTSKIETDKNLNTNNESNIYSDYVNGYTTSLNYYKYIRQGWLKLYRYYENTTLSSYVVFTSLQDLITGDKYSTTTLFQTLACIREMAFGNNEFPVRWF
ncbi:MAG: hypothetical protein ACTSVI_03460 [Promethearchaeota archaeon]